LHVGGRGRRAAAAGGGAGEQRAIDPQGVAGARLAKGLFCIVDDGV
jgi:hypothetical protein